MSYVINEKSFMVYYEEYKKNSQLFTISNIVE